MRNEEVKVGDIYAECFGYSMILFNFYKVMKVSDKSVWLQELTKKVTEDTTDCFRPYVVAGEPKPDTPVKCVRRTKYIGSKWNGQPLQEDHLD